MKSISRRALAIGLSGVALFEMGCASDAPASPLPPPDGSPSADDFSGQTGSPGAAECTEPEICRTSLEAQAQALAGTSNSVRVTHYECSGSYCRGVLEVDGRCVAAPAIGSGRSYDCGLGAEAILRAEDDQLAAERRAMQPATPQGGAWQRPDHYENGSLGYIELGVNSERWGGFARPPTFFAGASFFRLEGRDDDAVLGEILDPLQGIDDCGVLRLSAPGIGVGTSQDYFQIGSA